MDQRRHYWYIVVLLSSLLAEAAFFWEWENPLRWILVFWFLLFCPGIAFAYLLPSKDQITRVFLVVVISVALDTVVAEAVLYLGKWSPHLILLILIGFCWVGVILNFYINIVRHVPASTISDSAQSGRITGIGFYLRIIKSGWWLVLISSLIAVNYSFVYSYYFAVPKYEAVAQFIVSPNPLYSAPADQQIPDKYSIISTYADILNSRHIRDGVLELLRENPDDFTEYTTSAILLPDEDIIRFSVKGPNPETAAILAESIGQYAIDSIRTFYFAYDIDFLDHAPAPLKPYQPHPVQNASLALLIGLVTGVGLTIFRDDISTAWNRTDK